MLKTAGVMISGYSERLQDTLFQIWLQNVFQVGTFSLISRFRGLTPNHELYYDDLLISNTNKLFLTRNQKF